MSTVTDSHGSEAAQAHPKHLAHHFDTPRQQYESGKTGMWLFLSTEILLFSGLFCAYAVYRANHPEIFVYAHQYLSKTLGGINTLVLILSSFTAAWAVRAAQRGQKRLLTGLVATTLVCAFAFLGIKGVEYHQKWRHGLLWGQHYKPTVHEMGAGHEGAAGRTAVAPSLMVEGEAYPPEAGIARAEAPTGEVGGAGSTPSLASGQPPAAAAANDLLTRSNIAPAAEGPAGLSRGGVEAGTPEAPAEAPKNVQIFFGIYFVMTGLHALHVIAGMTAFFWILVRSLRGEFGRDYFTPVDLTALYWHLVDLIWIYLFPLLYLIH